MRGKRRRRGAAFVSMVLLMLTCFAPGIEAQAVDVSDIEHTSEYKETDLKLSEMIQKIKANKTKASLSGNSLPIFLVWITDGENSDFCNAFYVRDTYRTGGTYLVTSALVDQYLEAGLDVYVLNENIYAEVTDSCTDTTGVFAYLQADGFENLEPMEMTGDFMDSDASITSLVIEDGEYVYQYIDVSMRGWSESEGLYYDGENIDSTVNVGSPAVDMDSLEVFGMQVMTSDNLRVLCDLNAFPFNEEGIIVEGTAVSSEEEEIPVSDEDTDTSEPEQSEEPQESEEPQADSEAEGSSDSKKWIGIAAVLAAVIYLIKKKQPEKRENTPKQKANHQEHTVNLQPRETIEKTQPIESKQPEEDKVLYQIRGIGGTFDGCIFEIKGSTQIGRSRECHIVYPPKTGGVSGNHCVIGTRGERTVINDLNSTYGTFLRNTKLEPQIDYYLNVGDVFYLGEAKQSFRLEKSERKDKPQHIYT